MSSSGSDEKSPVSPSASASAPKRPKPDNSQSQEVLRQWFQQYVRQFTTGCGVSSCTSSRCASNSGFLALSNDAAVREALNTIKAHKDQLICSNIKAGAAQFASAPPAAPSSIPVPAPVSVSVSANSSDVPVPMSDADAPETPERNQPAAAPAPLPLSSTILPAAQLSAEQLQSALDARAAASGSASSPPPALAPASSSPVSRPSLPPSFPPAVLPADFKPIRLVDLRSQFEVGSALTPPSYSTIIRYVGAYVADPPLFEHSFPVYSPDSSAALEPSESSPAVDLDEITEIFNFFTERDPIRPAFDNALRRLVTQYTVRPAPEVSLWTLRAYFILLENPNWIDPETYDTFKLLLKAIGMLSGYSRATMIRWLSSYSLEKIERIVGTLQQFITVRFYLMSTVMEVAGAVQTLGLFNQINDQRTAAKEAALPYQAFYNDAVNLELNLEDDFRHWKRRNGFSFANQPFVLDPGAKARLLQIDAQVQMYHEIDRIERDMPVILNRAHRYLILKVRRAHLIQDTLNQLAHRSANDFKKPLKVVFAGESGIDEGGLRKEFFSLLISSLFDSKYGMFLYQEETRKFHFNPNSLDSPSEFELIGILLGLAIYNSIILDIQFPLVYYKKLLEVPSTSHSLRDDLADYSPSLWTGLKSLLNFDGDVENTFCRTFTVDVECYGVLKSEELKAGGAQISLTKENREEYVDLYADWLMNRSIEKQFRAFFTGFHLVAGGPGLQLFRPAELEMLICGSPNFDFESLEETTRYEDGFTKESVTIRHFWEIAHSLDIEHKKKLLHFCTGSDRVPIRGLAAIQLVISKLGPDSDSLPLSHTCFNHLVIPDYQDKEKLRQKLLLALKHTHGFGII